MIEKTGQMKADSVGQVCLASSRDIAVLVHGGGAGPAANAPGTDVEALLEIEVDAERLYWEEPREGESEQVELFYLLGENGVCEVVVLANEPWSAHASGGSPDEPDGATP